MSQRETLLNVAGMTCPACTRHVTAALTDVPGVEGVEVRLRAGIVLVRHAAGASASSMVAALSAAGYDSRLQVGPLQAGGAGEQRR